MTSRVHQTVRLGVIGLTAGQMAPPDADGVVGRSAARWMFLEVVGQEAQHVIDELFTEGAPLVRDPALRLYLSAADQPLDWKSLASGRGTVPGSEAHRLSGDGAAAIGREWERRRDAAYSRLKKAVRAWGERWRLADEWMMEVAVQSLLRWGRLPAESVENPEWSPSLWPLALLPEEAIPRSPDEEGRTFPGESAAEYVERLGEGRRWTWAGGVGPWLPAVESEKSYLRRVREYARAVYTAYRRAGWKPALRKKALATHLRWVVQLHVLDWTVPRVCGSEGLGFEKGGRGDSSVRKAYRATSALLGLTPRRDLADRTKGHGD